MSRAHFVMILHVRLPNVYSFLSPAMHDGYLKFSLSVVVVVGCHTSAVQSISSMLFDAG